MLYAILAIAAVLFFGYIFTVALFARSTRGQLSERMAQNVRR